MLFKKRLVSRSPLIPSAFSIPKRLVRQAIHARLKYLPFGRSEAGFWSRAFTKYPSLFRGFGHDIQKTVEAFPGLRMELGIRDRVQKTIVVDGHWDPQTAITLQALLRSGDTMFDVGANIGYFSMLASTLVGPEGRIFAFEPSLRALTKLVRHLEMNQVRNVVVCSLGLADQPALLSLYRASASNIGMTSLGASDISQGDVETILTHRLDDFFAGLDAVPRVVKLDVEGAELLALRGMEKMLRDAAPYVLCEVIDEYLAKLDCTSAEMYALMDALGYRAYIPAGQPGSGRWALLDDWSRRAGDEDVLFAHAELPAELLAN